MNVGIAITLNPKSCSLREPPGGATQQRHPCVAIAADLDLGTVAVGVLAKGPKTWGDFFP